MKTKQAFYFQLNVVVSWCLSSENVMFKSTLHFPQLLRQQSYWFPFALWLFLEISSLSEKDILVLRLDLTDRSSHEAATNSVLKHFGKVRCASGVKLLSSVSYTCIYVRISLLFYCMVNSPVSTSFLSFSIKLAKKYLNFHPFCCLLLGFSRLYRDAAMNK